LVNDGYATREVRKGRERDWTELDVDGLRQVGFRVL
jgi:hypothetical protein